MNKVAPLELLHALLFRLKDRSSEWDDAEKQEWTRMLLSAPARFFRMDKGDTRYAESMNWRTKIVGTAQVVKLTFRQICYNIAGFRVRKESTSGPQSAAKIAEFHKQHCLETPGDTHMSKTVVDSLRADLH